MSIRCFSKAHKSLKEALEGAKTMGMTDDSWTASIYNNLGICCWHIKKHEEAAECYRNALRIWSVTLPRNHPFIPALYQNIGFLYSDMGWYEEALDNYVKALDLKLTQSSEDYTGIVTIYEGMGVCYFRMHMYEKAMDYYRKALDTIMSSIPEETEGIGFFRDRISQEYAEADQARMYR